MSFRAIAAAALILSMPDASPAAPLAYPVTATVPQTDVLHGVTVADPYRWLEGDVRTQKPVADWVAAENRVTQAYLATLPGRDALKARLTQLFDYERITLPEARGDRLFFRRNSGLQNQAVLMLDDGTGASRVLIDPNMWSKDGATALAEWSASPDGKRIAYAVQDGGTDWRTIKLLDVDSGKVMSDDLDWVKFSGIAWNADSSGFYYSRHPATPRGKDFVSAVYDHSVYFHKVGTPQDADTLVYASPENRGYYNIAETSADGHWLVIRSSTGSDDTYEVRVKDVTDPDFALFTLIAKRTDDWRFVGNIGTSLYFVTNAGAPKYRVVAFDNITHVPRDIVPEGKDTITGAHLVGDHLVVTALHDASTAVRRYSLDGVPQGVVALPGLGTATGFESGPGTGQRTSNTAYYAFTSYNAPTTIYRYNADTNASSVFAAPKVAFDPADFVVEQRFFTSKDGTRVPMFIAHKKSLDLSKGAPTLMYGYGGFNINVLPAFQVDALSWMEMGGVYAEVTLRGGGEYGAAWHDDGKLLKKQNVFDDFIAGGEYLIASGITPKGGLAIQGGSNGGLLVGAVVNQRPDLFAAALPAVGVMDMLRFPLFTEGRTWTDDYGDPADAVQFRNLYGYSPYHNIKSGKDYPAILVTTADTDDRVVPGHSFKYAAALQAAKIGDKPHLIRIETRAGHGSGKPTSKQIDEIADLWSFIGYWTGLTRK
ncbi:prolyl oligopeptidase family serine peptidase [Polymorphobacter fuscus]|uniref:prolyl oligopeptidase n=1 Tax=Sandarakinorhabdus fusca TaxID=1439888 RepID=A0A7C9GP38_9SPHN|nr:prolyl oligopeptidase family serine peptidase [Polymorphobacter fuscus]KAB7647427.1 S9 family peptidase [Polymorphobacter fuscus]MQT16676.1 prolyl oligopeptidase family serine peptidase [Polymorphobacter fuscus]NJC09339.1 prolyl oligopeptidase [Polymorphobacter fuscus]